MTRNRRAMTLAETLVVIAIAVILITVLYKFLMSGIRQGEDMTEELNLLIDVRALVEHMARDVAAAHVILPPDSGGDFKTSLTLARYNSEDASDRVDTNSQNPVYPFMEVTSTTTVKLKCSRVKYQYDASKGQVTRIEEKGTLEGKPGSTGGQRDLKTIADYSFTAESTVRDTVKGPASHIAQFDLAYMFYDDKGQVKLAGSAGDVYRTASVALSLKAIMNSGLYAKQDGKAMSRRLPEVLVTTKFWSQRRLSEAMYPEYFSSADDDLRF